MTLESDRGRIKPPNLDDRTWQDLVDEMRALIPRYAPQWTDHNPSDLGITLIELFAWLGEGIIFRLNQTPEKNYLAFLGLLGITRDPPTPARTFLTFRSSVNTAVTVPAGTRAQAVDPAGRRPVVFETDDDVVVLPTTLTAALQLPPQAPAAVAGSYCNQTGVLIGPPTANLLVEVPAGQAVPLLLGFDRAVTGDLELGLRLYQTVPVPDDQPVADLGPLLSGACSDGTKEPSDWPAVTLVDGTRGLTNDGVVRVTPPAGWTAQRAGGPAASRPWTTVTPADGTVPVPDPLFWVRLSIGAPAGRDVVVGIDRLLFNSASARTALTTRDAEPIGTGTGEPFQVLTLANRPLLRRPGLSDPYGDLVVQVESGSPPAWQDWRRVEDLQTGPGAVYRLEPVTGEVRFGDYDDQRRQGSGSVPPAGTRIQALRYRYVDSGAAGNVGPEQIRILGDTPAKQLPPGIATVTNLGPARDGADEEPIADTMRRAPEELRIRDRAVTADDYEFLAKEAAGDLRVIRCLPPRAHTDTSAGHWSPGDPWEFGGLDRAPGAVNLIIVPDRDLTIARPEPTRDQIRLVQGYLDARRDLTAGLAVVGPRYLPIIVQVEILIWAQAEEAGASRAGVEVDTRARIQSFLHPTRGGPDGTGWAVGDPVFTSDVFQALMPARDLGYISVLQVRPADVPAYHEPPLGPGGVYQRDVERPFRLSDFSASVRLADYELVCAAEDDQQLVTVNLVQV